MKIPKISFKNSKTKRESMDSIGEDAESDFANEHFAEEFSTLNSVKEK